MTAQHNEIWHAAFRELAQCALPTSFTTDDVSLVNPNEIPQPQRALLDHEEHMTLTLQRHHGRELELRVLSEHLSGSCYRRMITLAIRGTQEIAEFGMVRIGLDLVPPAVRTEILHQAAPLGEILVRHRVLRRVEPKWFLRFGPQHSVLSYFGGSKTEDAFGRIGIIHCDAQPAIELLEVVPRYLTV